MNATTCPATLRDLTLRDLFKMAAEQGVRPSDLLPPEGFVMQMDSLEPDLEAGYYDGPSEAGDDWRIETTFTIEDGVTFELLTPDLTVITNLTTSGALEAGNALARLATKYARQAV